MHKIGIIDFVNSIPYALPFDFNAGEQQFSPHFASPKTLYRQLCDGEIGAAFISAGELIGAPPQIQLVSSLGIAAEMAVDSVCLFLNRGTPQVDGSVIALPSASAASTLLLKIICREYWRVTPKFIHFDQDREESAPCDGRLLIGDACLRYLNEAELKGDRRIDLVEEWNSFTHTPFVFAHLAINSKIFPKSAISPLSELLIENLRWADSNFSTVIETASRQLPSLQPSQLSRYFNLLHYTLRAPHYRGLQLFFQYSRNLNASP